MRYGRGGLYASRRAPHPSSFITRHLLSYLARKRAPIEIAWTPRLLCGYRAANTKQPSYICKYVFE